ncbi:MAG: L,D-transpeptidase family protein [Sphingomonas sp.]
MRTISIALAAAAALLAYPVPAQQVERGGRAIFDVAPELKNGQYLWAPELASEGPALVIVNLATQRLIVFRNGVPIGASTISSGKDGYQTPTGVFTILQKAKEHYSKTYNNAPMPNMQRLTWKGIALHAGNLPGYPASHGCIRLPTKFSNLLFGTTSLGMTVVITSLDVTPEVSRAPQLADAGAPAAASLSNAAYEWHAGRARRGIVSVVVSTSDQRAIVLQDGVEIGSAPVRYSGELSMPVAYVLRSREAGKNQWLKLHYSGSGGSMDVTSEEASKFDAPITFRHQLATLLRPGSIVIVTPKPLKAGSLGSSLTVIENDESAR